ncbi:hypothetical protein J6590_096436, partial [Homalodisca vitripennis]
CSKPVLRAQKQKIQCKPCKGYFHWNCVNLTEAEFEVFSSSNTKWTCNPCTQKKRLSRSFSDSSPPNMSPGNSTVTMEDIKSMLEEMKREILEGQSKVESELGKSINHCLELISDNNKLIETQKKLIDDQQKKISSLQEENNRLQVKFKDISDRQAELDQYSRRNTLEIFGIPEEGPAESSDALKKKVIEIGTALGTTLSEDAIDACHRIGGGNNRPTSGIIVKFLRRDDADNLLQNAYNGVDCIQTSGLCQEKFKIFP